MPTGGFSTLFNLFFADYLGWPRNWNGLLIYLLNSDGVLTGLMVGRTQSFGSQIEKREIVLASVVLLVHPIVVLIPSAITLAFPDTYQSVIPLSRHFSGRL